MNSVAEQVVERCCGPRVSTSCVARHPLCLLLTEPRNVPGMGANEQRKVRCNYDSIVRSARHQAPSSPVQVLKA